MMKYCIECGALLTERYLKNEGEIPYCPRCQVFRFPVFNTAVSMVVKSPDQEKILLIQQYGKKKYILVAGYVNQGESAEHAVAREVKEELGLNVVSYAFNRSEYFAPSNTLMLNFNCTVDSEDLSGMTDEVDTALWMTRDEIIDGLENGMVMGSLAEKFLKLYLADEKAKR